MINVAYIIIAQLKAEFYSVYCIEEIIILAYRDFQLLINNW